jgi:integrase
MVEHTPEAGPALNRMKELKKVLADTDQATAFKWLADEKTRVQAGVHLASHPQVRFAEYVSSLLVRKVKAGDIKSAKGRERWGHTLQHLIAGTEGEEAGMFVPGFGEFFIDRIHVTHVEAWRTSIATIVAAGDYSPNTTNGWLAILRVIMKAAKREFGLAHLATEDVDDFDVSEHDTYSEEEPNALLPEEVPAFLDTMRGLYPQHYAMVFLGIATGLRPSSLRPLRRQGPEADVLWDNNRILVRRSQTLGEDVMRTTKQKRKYAIDLPEEVMNILRWHVETQLKTPEQKESRLLFPAVHGGFRSPSVLNKPFADVAETMGLGRKLSQRGLRRTFNDLARAAKVADLVTRSISGHLTESMQRHYSTVSSAEQRDGIARVIDFAKARHEHAVVHDAPSGAQK